jgi:hypothetical protein
MGASTGKAVLSYTTNEIVLAEEPTQESMMEVATKYFTQKRNEQLYE